MSEKNEVFNYSYSAKQQEEVRRIREKYMSKEEDKMERLRRLDASATRPGSIAALIVGIIGSLVLGVGMCCTMVFSNEWFIPGIIIGIVGMAILGAAYPLYSCMTKKRRKKLAPEIIRLTDELSQE